MVSMFGYKQRHRQKNPTLSTEKKKYGGGNLKNNARDGFSGGAQRGLARARRRG